MSKKLKKPWPTKAVMEQIYEQHPWGGKDHDFYSGEGSHNTQIVKPYIDCVTTFLQNHKNPLTVCHLGCGDFNIGMQLVPFTKSYVGVDIVEALIKRNQKLYQNDLISFACLDISKDELPQADCIILRQVLQHLSNAEIQDILFKLTTYQYIILTEHLPMGDFTSNQDIISGQGIRLKHNSGVDITQPPFNFKVKSQQILNEIVLENQKGRIMTTLFNLK
ncbi:class I SAM-dependent methyltransferase [Hanstruepera flava]|uniref:class I SAM-dependent methyltransferase n=1 Tax=Hanstruepera flava TaxID=2930218 RepID=UPI0020295FA6|nr:class I SAM-dependent methyltransferase [Hanstruepera flava]